MLILRNTTYYLILLNGVLWGGVLGTLLAMRWL